MEQLVETLDFSLLVDGDTGKIDPHLIDDFSFGNQRGERSKTEFADLCATVKKHGVISPLTLQASQNGNHRLQCIAGHGRRDAALANNLTNVPFVFRIVGDEQAFAMHISENEDREDLSFIAKSKSVLQYMTEFKGDVEAVASQLNFTIKECRELVEINKCSDKVKQAISDKHITPSHAIILAPFPKGAQDQNLPAIVAEKWTVRVLRERVGKAKLPLDRGVFDKTECENCEFNTVPQLGLFGSNDTKAECAKTSCFQAKTTAYMELQKIELQPKYGHILLLSQTSNNDRVTVSANVVGESQFGTCGPCDDRVAVLSDSWGKAGDIIENQCVNKVCFNKCKTAFAAEVKAQQSTLAQTSSDSPQQQAYIATKQAVKTAKTTVNATLPNNVTELYKCEYRKAAAKFYASDERFIACLLSAALISHAGLKIGDDISSRFSDALVKCLGMTNEQRQALIREAATQFLTKTDTDARGGNVTDTLIRCLAADKDTALPFVTEYWMPTDTNLTVYTKKLLKPLAESAGVKKLMEAKELGSFAKLLNKPKTDLIKGIQTADVDWASYAPKNFTVLINK